jgi:hypothetical protein
VREARASGVTGGVPVPSKWQWMSAEVERLREEYARLMGLVEEAARLISAYRGNASIQLAYAVLTATSTDSAKPAVEVLTHAR